MPAPRLAVLLASGLVALVPAAPALAQSAGDDQYADPLGQTEEATPAPAPAPAPAEPAPEAQSGTAAQSSGTAAATATPRATASSGSGAAGAAELPRTGLDVGLVGIVGTALVLLGIGLRLRTADARP